MAEPRTIRSEDGCKEIEDFLKGDSDAEHLQYNVLQPPFQHTTLQDPEKEIRLFAYNDSANVDSIDLSIYAYPFPEC